jgi:hypothetical protein
LLAAATAARMKEKKTAKHLMSLVVVGIDGGLASGGLGIRTEGVWSPILYRLVGTLIDFGSVWLPLGTSLDIGVVFGVYESIHPPGNLSAGIRKLFVQ